MNWCLLRYCGYMMFAVRNTVCSMGNTLSGFLCGSFGSCQAICFCQSEWMRSLSSSFGVCFSNDTFESSFLYLEFFSPASNSFFSSGVSTINGLIGTGFFVTGSRETIVVEQLIITSSCLGDSPGLGALATWREISMLLRPVQFTWPESSRSHISVSGLTMVILSKAAVTVVTPGPVCLYATIPDRASRSMNNVP